jgi:hypothetical protein
LWEINKSGPQGPNTAPHSGLQQIALSYLPSINGHLKGGNLRSFRRENKKQPSDLLGTC